MIRAIRATCRTRRRKSATLRRPTIAYSVRQMRRGERRQSSRRPNGRRYWRLRRWSRRIRMATQMATRSRPPATMHYRPTKTETWPLRLSGRWTAIPKLSTNACCPVALNLLQQAVGRDPADTAARDAYAYALGRNRDLQAALAQLDEVIKRQPRREQALAAAASMLMSLQQWSPAAELWERAREVNPWIVPLLDGPRAVSGSAQTLGCLCQDVRADARAISRRPRRKAVARGVPAGGGSRRRSGTRIQADDGAQPGQGGVDPEVVGESSAEDEYTAGARRREGQGNPGSQAPPGNPLLARLCLARLCRQFDRRQRFGRRSLPYSAFPGGAWEREALGRLCFCKRVGCGFLKCAANF